MENELEKNNDVTLTGEVVSEREFAYELYGEKFYEFLIKINRLSGNADVLPATISERIMTPEIAVGKQISIAGQFRSFNKLEDGHSRLKLTVFIKKILPQSECGAANIIALEGYICKPPVYRITPLNREITDILIAVNRGYNKSDYIPAILWGRNARFAGELAVGTKISITGRIQSREYQKKRANGDMIKQIAYEVSCSCISAVGGGK